MKKSIRILMCAMGLVLVGMSQEAQADQQTSYAHLARLSTDLHRALEPEQRQTLHPVPVFLEKMPAPYLQPSKHFTGSNMVSAVYISAGFIDVMNSLSYAMALEGSQKGYLKRYLQQLAQAEGAVAVQPVANRDSIDISNHQISNFNQISTSLVAMDMAHHYLGHYEKYSNQLGERQTTPINNVVTPAEWRLAVLHGANNALACGLGVEGLQYLFKSISDMPSRPAWTEYFMPQEVNVRKLNRDLTRLQDCFFAGQKFKY